MTTTSTSRKKHYVVANPISNRNPYSISSVFPHQITNTPPPKTNSKKYPLQPKQSHAPQTSLLAELGIISAAEITIPNRRPTPKIENPSESNPLRNSHDSADLSAAPYRARLIRSSRLRRRGRKEPDEEKKTGDAEAARDGSARLRGGGKKGGTRHCRGANRRSSVAVRAPTEEHEFTTAAPRSMRKKVHTPHVLPKW